MIYFWITFVILVGLLGGYYYRKKFFVLNQRLLDYLENSSFTTRIDCAKISFSATGAWGLSWYKLYSDGHSIILTDYYDLNPDKNRKLYAETYLITTPDQLSKYPVAIFRNVLIAKTIEINSNDNLVLKGSMTRQTIISKMPWLNGYDTTIKIKKPFDNFDFTEIINTNR